MPPVKVTKTVLAETCIGVFFIRCVWCSSYNASSSETVRGPQFEKRFVKTKRSVRCKHDESELFIGRNMKYLIINNRTTCTNQILVGQTRY
jgi:hypothetical protein